MKEQTIKRAGIMQRAWALLLAAALCLGLMPGAAWAEEGEGAGTAPESAQKVSAVTLTVVKGVSDWSGPSVVVNKTYKFTGQATVKDLFETAKKAGDIDGYAFADAFGTGSEFLSSLTPKGGSAVEGASGWWSSFVGGIADDGSKTAAASPLADGDVLQFAWCDSVPNVAPTAEQWEALASEAAQGDGVAGDENAAKAGSASIAIVQGMEYKGPIALLNKTYAFSKGATVKDLFEAAKKAGDIKAYAFNGFGYLDSITTAAGVEIKTPSDWSSSWSIFKNGSAAGFDESKPNEGKDVDVLTDGDVLQFAWCDSVPNVAPTAEQWKALADAAVSGDSVIEGEAPVRPSPSAPKVDAAVLDGSLNAVYRALFANLAGTLEGAGGASDRNISSWKAMEAAAIGQVGLVDADAAIADAVASYNAPANNNLQRSIIVLTALGIDATKVPSGQGTLNLVEKLASDASAVSAYPTSAAFALLAYASGSYEVASDAVNSARALIDGLSAAQSSEGGYLAMGSIDVDTTAMVIPALAVYQGDATAKTALDKAVAALRGAQKGDGSFGNVNSTAMAVIALCSVGIDPASESEWAGSAATPLKALLSFAKEDMTGFSVATGMEEDMVNEQGFRALVAYQGLKNTGAAYNIYTQAKLGQAGLPAEKQEEESAPAPADKPVVDKKALAKTGDGSAPFAAGTAVLALGALAAGIAATRRMRVSDELSLRR